MAPGGRRSQAHLTAQTHPQSVEQVPATSSADIVPPKRRGRAANESVKKFKKGNNGQRPRIVIKEGMMTPVGEWSTEFVNEIGIICRNHAPLTIRDWRVVPRGVKNTMHGFLKLSFDIDLHLPHVRKAVDKFLGLRFRDYRHTLHKHYKSFGDDDINRRKKPFDNVGQEAWISICDWFASEKFQKLSKKNSANRKENKSNHCSGAKSFVRFRAEKTDPITQAELGVIEMYRRTHFSDKRGCWIDSESERRYVEMINIQSDPNALIDGVTPTEEAIFEKVLGVRPHYTRGMGHGMMPVSPSVSLNDNHPAVEEFRRSTAEAIRRAEEADRRAEAAERRAEDQDQTIQTMQVQLAFLMERFGGNNP